MRQRRYLKSLFLSSWLTYDCQALQSGPHCFNRHYAITDIQQVKLDENMSNGHTNDAYEGTSDDDAYDEVYPTPKTRKSYAQAIDSENNSTLPRKLVLVEQFFLLACHDVRSMWRRGCFAYLHITMSDRCDVEDVLLFYSDRGKCLVQHWQRKPMRQSFLHRSGTRLASRRKVSRTSARRAARIFSKVWRNVPKCFSAYYASCWSCLAVATDFLYVQLWHWLSRDDKTSFLTGVLSKVTFIVIASNIATNLSCRECSANATRRAVQPPLFPFNESLAPIDRWDLLLLLTVRDFETVVTHGWCLNTAPISVMELLSCGRGHWS